MNFFSPILAQAEDGASDGVGWSSMNDEVRNRLITFGAYALVMAVILVWVIFIRKQRNKRRIHRRKPHNWQLSEDTKGRRHHRRRHQTAESPKNPSLAESGGLPPRRGDDVPPSGP